MSMEMVSPDRATLCSRENARRAFTLIEVLVSAAIMAFLLLCVLTLMNMVSSAYSRTMGKLDSFEAARAAFDVMGRTLRQATLLSHLGYDDPKRPAAYQLKSDLHFLSGPQDELGLAMTGLERSDAVFFQAPLGVTDDAALRSANQLLTSIGFFIAYGDDPLRPAILDGKVEPRWRYRLFQFIEPREKMTVYQRTIGTEASVPVSKGAYMGTDWFADAVNDGKSVHPLAENVIGLVIRPVYQGSLRRSWNSRDAGSPDICNRLPQALQILLVAIDERSAAQLGNGETPPDLLPADLDGLDFEEIATDIESKLTEHKPRLTYRLFKTVVPLDAANTKL